MKIDRTDESNLKSILSDGDFNTSLVTESMKTKNLMNKIINLLKLLGTYTAFFSKL